MAQPRVAAVDSNVFVDLQQKIDDDAAVKEVF